MRAFPSSKQLRRPVVVVSAACFCAIVLGDGCYLGGYRASAPSTTVPPWVSEPLTAPAGSATGAAAVTAVPQALAPSDGSMFDPATIVPVLEDPALREVKDLVLREAYQPAADKLEAVLAPAPTPSPALLFQLGVLRAKSGMPGPAVQAYDRAASFAWPLSEHARLRAARLLVEMGQPADALVRVDAAAPVSTLADEVALVRVHALAALHRIDEAAPFLRSYLAREPRPSDWQQEALRYAKALLEEPSVAHAEEAAKVAAVVVYQSPFGRAVGEAKALEERALATLPYESQKRFVEPGKEEQASRARMLADANQGREALAVADRLLAELTKENADVGEASCEAHSARGKALSSLKRYSESTDAFGSAIERCQGSRLASAYFLGARAALRGGRPALARQRYAELEQRFRSHRLADDARFHGAEAARDLGDLAAFTAMLLRIADDYPEGDMVDQGLFALALAKIEQGDWSGAIWPLERSIERQKRGRPYWSEGRPQYFLARARIETGQLEAGKAALATVVREFPLSYFMLLAESRLHAQDPAYAKQVLDEARAAEPHGQFVIPDHPELHRPEFERAVELVREGEGAAAVRELEALGVRDRTAHPSLLWASAFLLARIEAPAESHGLLRSVDLWTEHFPSGLWRPIWEVAYPRPYAAIVPGAAERFGIPPHLAYAIMREESAFKPNVSSPAAAYGLMQLIVPTAKTVAAPLGLPFDERALKTPAINITLGSRFLGVLTRRFAYDPLLAIPGYNAGPGAPERWVDARPNADFDVFVESIPYTETREYTKRVMKTMAAYAVLYGDGVDAALVRPPLKVKPVMVAGPMASPLEVTVPTPGQPIPTAPALGAP
jgi:soluble lytic murein transglycosylase